MCMSLYQRCMIKTILGDTHTHTYTQCVLKVLSLEFIKLGLPSFTIESSCSFFICVFSLDFCTKHSAKSRPSAHKLFIWKVLFFSTILFLLTRTILLTKKPKSNGSSIISPFKDLCRISNFFPHNFTPVWFKHTFITTYRIMDLLSL